MHAQHLDAGDLLDHRLHDRPGRFDQLGADLFEQISAFLGRERLDQLFFGRRQDALEADQEEIADQVRAGMSLGLVPCIPAQTGPSLRRWRLRFHLGFSSLRSRAWLGQRRAPVPRHSHRRRLGNSRLALHELGASSLGLLTCRIGADHLPADPRHAQIQIAASGDNAKLARHKVAPQRKRPPTRSRKNATVIEATPRSIDREIPTPGRPSPEASGNAPGPDRGHASS